MPSSKSSYRSIFLGLFIAVSSIQPVFSHCVSGRTLGVNTTSVDLYRVRCFNDGSGNADRLVGVVNLVSGGSTVRAQIAREGFKPSAISIDSTNGASNCNLNHTIELNRSSQLAGANGNGDYNILVNKTGTNQKVYDLIFYCETLGHVVTGVTEVRTGAAAPELVGNAAISPDIDLLIDQ